MGERDYNSPEYDRPNYETAEEYNRARREKEAKMGEEESSYYSAAYDTWTSQNRAYTGSSMVDAAGNPLKNNFALKLVISIMMIMGCCCSNYFLVIVGIIALVFTCKANTAYQQGDAESFKRSSRISSVLLGVGGVVWAIMLIVGIIFFSMANKEFVDSTGSNLWEILEEDVWGDFEDIFDMDSDYEEPDVSYEFFEDRKTPLPDYFKDFSIAGKDCSMPLSYAELRAAKFELEDFTEDAEIRVGDLESFSLYWNESYYGHVCFTNYGEHTLELAQSRISSITFYDEPDISGELIFFGSITWDSNYEEIERLFGKPQYVYREEYDTLGTYEHYTWSFDEEGNGQGVGASFANGQLYKITIEWFDK